MAKTKIRVAMYTPYSGPTEVKDNNGAHVEFKGISDEAGDSVKDRAAWMHMKLSQAENQTKADGADVLKIFVGPEWSFRKRVGQYTEAERDEILKACELTSKAFPKWLYCAGSILWGKSEKAGKEAEKMRIFNCAPAYYNGKQLLLLYKKNDADVYKIAKNGGCTARPETDTEIWGLYKSVDGDKGTFDNGAVSKYVKPGTFKCEDLSFGLEICRDHVEGVLKTTLGSKKVDVHIYPKCSNGTFADKCGARDGGYVLACEGNNEKPDINEKTSSQVYKMANGLPGQPLHIANANVRKVSGANLANRLVVYEPLDL